MSRVTDVRREAGQVVVVLRPHAVWEAIAFPLGMLAALGIVASVMPDRHSVEARAISGLVWLGGGLVLGSLSHLVASLLAGREEVVTVSGAQLVIDHQVMRLPETRRRRTYAVDGIVNLRAVGPTKPQRPWLVGLAFDYHGLAVKFGSGVGGPDADRVLQALMTVMPPAAGEPARGPSTGGVDARPRAWSRVTLLAGALCTACLGGTALAWPLDPTKMTLALAIAVVGSGFIPMWVMVILLLESRGFWRSRLWLRVGVLLCWVAGLVAATSVAVWVKDEVLSPFRSVQRGDVQALWSINVLMLIGGMFWAAYRAEKRGWRVQETRGPPKAAAEGR